MILVSPGTRSNPAGSSTPPSKLRDKDHFAARLTVVDGPVRLQNTVRVDRVRKRQGALDADVQPAVRNPVQQVRDASSELGGIRDVQHIDCAAVK